MKNLLSLLIVISSTFVSTGCSTEAAYSDTNPTSDNKKKPTQQDRQDNEAASVPNTSPSQPYSETPTASQNKIVRVKLSGLKDSSGLVCYSLFTSATGFPNTPQDPSFAKCLEAGNTKDIEITLPGDTNKLAISVYHDANSNNVLDTGVFGIPKEGFGFSNTPPVGMSAPTFEQTSVLLSSQTEITIKFNYLF